MELLATLQSLLQASLRMGTPLAYTAIGETYGERAGVINIGLEGLMLIGALTAFSVTFSTGSIGLAVLAAAIVSGLLGGLFGFVTISLKANQIIAGVALNLIGLGATSFVHRTLFADIRDRAITPLTAIHIPILSDIPFVGPVLFQQNLLVYGVLLLAPVATFVLNRTMLGLALRSVGEKPSATATAGLSVSKLRYAAVIAGAMLAGIGGAYLPVAHANQFVEGMVAGRGFIALAIVVFGRWTPSGSLWASLLVGFAFALQFRLQSQNVKVPYQFVQIIPYVATIVVMILLRNRSAQPQALGIPYEEGG